MTPKIYASKPPPWESGGSQVERYESGLVRVTQAYLCPADQRETIAAQFAVGNELTGINSPAYDGLYIYPEPTTQDENNGFARITVTAYGRVNPTNGGYSVEMRYIRKRFEWTYTENGQEITTENDFYVPDYRVLWVFRQGDLPIYPFITDLQYRDSAYIINPIDETITLFEGIRTLEVSTSPATGYGTMQEQVYNVSVIPRIQQ